MNVTLLIFILVYIAMGFGKLPGFKIDRTGAAVVGALAMMALGSISARQRGRPWITRRWGCCSG